MKTRILSLLAVVLGVTLTFTSPALATKPHPEHKVWICHATSGLGELKNGYNLIYVDEASTQYQAHKAHATTRPKHNPKFGTLYDYLNVDPQNLPGKCARPVPPTTTTQPPVTTTTAPTTTTTQPEVTTTTVDDPTTTTVVDTTVPPTTTTLPPPDLPKTGGGMTILWLGVILTLGGLAALVFGYPGGRTR